jgi:hypothetical protein
LLFFDFPAFFCFEVIRQQTAVRHLKGPYAQTVGVGGLPQNKKMQENQRITRNNQEKQSKTKNNKE